MRERVTDYADVFGTEAGKRVLLDLMQRGHILGEGAFDPNPYQHAFNAGENNIVRMIITTIQMNDLAFYKLVRSIPSMKYGNTGE